MNIIAIYDSPFIHNINLIMLLTIMNFYKKMKRHNNPSSEQKHFKSKRPSIQNPDDLLTKKEKLAREKKLWEDIF